MKKIIPVIISALIPYMVAGQSLEAFTPQSNLYDLSTGVISRSISFENRTGEKGQGGKAASHLGVARKGFPAKKIESGEVVELCNIKGTGTIRHIWMTGEFAFIREVPLLRTTVIRAYWDGQEHPSIECPLGDFMGFAHAQRTSYESAAHTTGENGALNFWIPMPFLKEARITLTNEATVPFMLFYQIDYTLNDPHEANIGRLHTYFKRENPTTMKKDFELLPKRTGEGRFLGTVIGVRTLYPDWWGEGEIKIYMDGDTEFPTICGTGSEDYAGLSYGIQETTFMYHGCNLNYTADTTVKYKEYITGETKDMQRQFISFYRWHFPDPIYWEKDCRITIQQIGYGGGYKDGLFERQDDWSSATFWYEAIPSAPLPSFSGLDERIAELDELTRFFKYE